MDGSQQRHSRQQYQYAAKATPPAKSKLKIVAAAVLPGDIRVGGAEGGVVGTGVEVGLTVGVEEGARTTMLVGPVGKRRGGD